MWSSSTTTFFFKSKSLTDSQKCRNWGSSSSFQKQLPPPQPLSVTLLPGCSGRVLAAGELVWGSQFPAPLTSSHSPNFLSTDYQKLDKFCLLHNNIQKSNFITKDRNPKTSTEYLKLISKHHFVNMKKIIELAN